MRAMVLALLTFSLKKLNFVKFCSIANLEQGFFITDLKEMWQDFGINLKSFEDKIFRKKDEISYVNQIKSSEFLLT
jgi:hypothetical protein